MKKLLFILLTVLFLGCSKDDSVKVKYTVLTNCYGFDVVYEDNEGTTIQETIESYSIWKKEFYGKRGDFVYLSAQGNCVDADVVVRIYYNGEIIHKDSKSGDYAKAIALGELVN